MTTSAWEKIALVLLGLILSLVVLEAGLRLGGFVLLSIQEYGNLQSIKQKGAYRILCLGESTTERAYPRFLEQVLNRHNIGVRFSVIEKGKSGTNTSAIVSRVESFLTEYHPDMVVTMMGINDKGSHMPFQALTTSEGTPFIQSLRTYDLARLLWLHILTKAKEMGFYKPEVDRRSSVKAQSSPLGTGFKETSAEAISTEGAFKKAIEINPRNDNAYVELGQLREEQGKFTQAEDFYKKAIEINPKNDNAYVELGWLYRVQGKFPQAEDFLKKTLELNPENDNARRELVRLYLGQNKFLQGEDSYRKAVEINPKNKVAYMGLGGLYRIQGKFSQGEASFKKAIEIDPKNSSIYVNLGELYRIQNKLSEAEDSVRKAIELNPNSIPALRAMASLCEEMGKPELAKEYAGKAKHWGGEDNAAITVHNYHKLKEILDRRGIKLVCVQYPMRNVWPLKKIFEKDKGVIFVDNESVFKEAVKKGSREEYFKDMFGGDFGHCTQKGNELLAQNIADVILREVFDKS